MDKKSSSKSQSIYTKIGLNIKKYRKQEGLTQ